MQEHALRLSEADEGIVQREAIVSVWMDGESDTEWPDALDGVVGRRAWATYHLIGDVLRTTELSLTPSATFNTCLTEVLSHEPAIVARAPRRLLKIGVTSLAAIFVLGSALWLARPLLPDFDAQPTELADATTDAADAPSLSEYLDAHWQMAGSGAVRYVSFDAGARR